MYTLLYFRGKLKFNAFTLQRWGYDKMLRDQDYPTPQGAVIGAYWVKVKRFQFVSRHSSVGIATGYGLDGRGSIPNKAKGFLSSPQRPDRPWDPPSLPSSEYRRFFFRGN
jgi:hypothetical protein